MAFTHETEEQVRDKIRKASVPIKDEWNEWEKQGPMTSERIKAFYKQTQNYIYDLGEWHLWSKGKRDSDLALVEDMKTKYKPKNILDFGGGVGLTAIPLARAGFDVMLADLDSKTLSFAKFRAERRGVPLKIWKSDVESAPTDAKYDVILILDVLEHLPHDELDAVVEKLIKLKHAKTEVIINAPFGKTAKHPMHFDLDDYTNQQIHRLQTEVPPI
jgi:2-polyprenyl-3-methyl-5-hydroxy-6-metoxy-1,4-benzoquinol methylase